MPPLEHAHLFCDLTQSWSERGGGIGTYLRRKRAYIVDATPHRHLLIVPGECDAVERDGRLTLVKVASPAVPRNPNYRLLVKSRAVRDVLAQHAPDFIECQDSYNLPWVALAHRKRHPETVLVGGYCTDFPTAYVQRFGARWFGESIASAARELAYFYCGRLYRHLDGIYALSEAGGAERIRRAARRRVAILPLGIDLDRFRPDRRDPSLRAEMGASAKDPILVYVGRLDAEKRCMTVFDAFRRLPAELGAVLVMLGEGRLRQPLIEASKGLNAHYPGYIGDPDRVASYLASSDVYVSGMADETFGLSVIEAQAAGLPVVGIAAGAMVERVPDGLGFLGPIDDSDVMAANIMRCLREDPAAIRGRARAHVTDRFSWKRTFETLFDDIYPRARARRASALRAGPSRRMGRTHTAAAADR